MAQRPSALVFKVDFFVTTLDLNANSIGDDDAKAITPSRSISTQAFKVDTVMTTLDLNTNSIGDDGVKAITSSWSILDLLTPLYF